MPAPMLFRFAMKMESTLHTPRTECSASGKKVMKLRLGSSDFCMANRSLGFVFSGDAKMRLDRAKDKCMDWCEPMVNNESALAR